jgi:hypothetical protein
MDLLHMENSYVVLEHWVGDLPVCDQAGVLYWLEQGAACLGVA